MCRSQAYITRILPGWARAWISVLAHLEKSLWLQVQAWCKLRVCMRRKWKSLQKWRRGQILEAWQIHRQHCRQSIRSRVFRGQWLHSREWWHFASLHRKQSISHWLCCPINIVEHWSHIWVSTSDFNLFYNTPVVRMICVSITAPDFSQDWCLSVLF